MEALRFNTSLTQLQLGGGDPVVGNEDVMRGIDLCTGSNALIREIVDGVKDIDDTDSKRRTALHHAVSLDRMDCTAFLCRCVDE